MSRRQQIPVFHFYLIPIIAAFLATANIDMRAFAQAAKTDSPNTPAPAPSLPAAESQPKSSADGIPARVIDGDQVQGILGKQIRSAAGEDMGRIVDVIVDRTARVRAAVIDFGGFLGVGNRQIAVAWNAIRFSSEGKRDLLVVDFTRDQLRVAPAYKAGEQIVLLGEPGNPNSPNVDGKSDKDAAPKDSPGK